MEAQRQNPEEILNKLRRERAAAGKGHLKIFFGYAAGVGKTYAMLQAAQAARRRGVDVVVGYVEPHTRPDTLSLLEGLEQLAPLQIEHRGLSLREFDLDGAETRRPELVLVDELAHTNAPGCRHGKRYQDVEELLTAGIDVYTTVNVQHLESLNDRIAAVTGVTVRERIPDRVFENADQVELVDIEPQELLDRLQTGKIYAQAQAQRALQGFFDLKNLTALRETALQQCADRMRRISERARYASQTEPGAGEHILVCLSPSPTNSKCIRTAARMAAAFRGSFTALFVETSHFSDMPDEDKSRLRANIHLAEQLGATIETVQGDDIPLHIAQFAHVSGVTKLVMGRSGARRKYFWSRPPLTELLTAAAPNLDIYIIPDRQSHGFQPPRVRQAQVRILPGDVCKSLVMLALATCVGFLFFRLGFSEANIITIYILSVLLTSVITNHRGYSLVSSIVSVLTFNYFFTEPRYTLSAYDSGYPATFLIMFISAFLTSTLAVRLKHQAHHAAQTAYRTKILLETNQLLQKGSSAQEIARIAAGQLYKLLRRPVFFYPAGQSALGAPLSFSEGAGEDTLLYTSENERAVAAWVYQNNKRAGATTATLGNSRCLYLAVRVNDTVYGVVGIAVNDDPLDSFENSVVLSILGECALALESEAALREREETAVLAKNEQLRANLLRSISHDLRTPLTSISGSASVLLESSAQLDDRQKTQLYTDIYDDSVWLTDLVENLLAVTRLEDGSTHLSLRVELVDEVVSEALRHIGRRKKDRQITVQSAEEVLLARMDARLIVQVIINLVDNALKYTPAGSEIVIRFFQEQDKAVVTVADNGDGIPDDAKPRIFDMFYTAQTKGADSRRSLGLGLSLCKSIITAHGGEITVEDALPHGTVFRFTLPIKEVAAHESFSNPDR